QRQQSLASRRRLTGRLDLSSRAAFFLGGNMRASESTLVLSGELWRRRYRCACNHDPLSLTDAQLVTCAYLVAGLFCNADRLANASELPDAFGNSVLARQRFCRLREALAPFGVDVLN